MTAGMRRPPWSCLLLATLASAAAAAAAAADAPLQLRIAEGDVINVLYQQGPVAAHLLLSSGTRPRVLVAFPAGNSGVVLWVVLTERDILSQHVAADRGPY